MNTNDYYNLLTVRILQMGVVKAETYNIGPGSS